MFLSSRKFATFRVFFFHVRQKEEEDETVIFKYKNIIHHLWEVRKIKGPTDREAPKKQPENREGGEEQQLP